MSKDKKPRQNDADAETISTAPMIIKPSAPPIILPPIHEPKIGDAGCFRNGRGEPCPAMVIRVREQRTAIGTTKKLLFIVYFDDVVQIGFVENVEIGTGIRQYWHSLREVEDILAAERERTIEKLPASVHLPGGSAGGPAGTITSSSAR